jgi:hypothetical protein
VAEYRLKRKTKTGSDMKTGIKEKLESGIAEH